MVLLVAEFTGWSNTELMDMDLDELGYWWGEVQEIWRARVPKPPMQQLPRR